MVGTTSEDYREGYDTATLGIANMLRVTSLSKHEFADMLEHVVEVAQAEDAGEGF